MKNVRARSTKRMKLLLINISDGKICKSEHDGTSCEIKPNTSTKTESSETYIKSCSKWSVSSSKQGEPSGLQANLNNEN
jgi:hypothetical protein